MPLNITQIQHHKVQPSKSFGLFVTGILLLLDCITVLSAVCLFVRSLSVNE